MKDNDNPSSQPPRIAVCIPTYNNAGTIVEVVRTVLKYCPSLIVVDDGSTDATHTTLCTIEKITVIRFGRNRGKGCALRAGMEQAAAMGFTHAITLDGDAQHVPEDLPLFMEKIIEEPDTLLVGNRVIPMGGAQPPKRSRIGRHFGNFWYRFNTGITLHDTQCGFRAYPLQLTLALGVRGRRYEFEQDALIRAAWNGIDVREVDIHLKYLRGDTRVSHFRPLSDFFRISAVNGRAAFLRVMFPVATFEAPGKTLREKIRAMVRYELKAHTAPRRAALSLATGVFMGLFPIHGFQVITLMGLTVLARLNRPLAFLGVCVSSPPMLPAIIVAAVAIGRLCVPSGLLSATMSPGLHAIFQGGVEFVVGSIVLAVVSGIAVFAVSYPVFLRISQVRKDSAR